MGKKILDSRLLYIVLSILIAVGLWLYITANDETPYSQTIRGIPVTFTGEDILAERGLMLVDGPYTASVTVQATPMVLSNLTNQTMQVTANVSGIAEEGTHTVSYTVVPPAGVSPSQFTVVSGVNGNVLTVEVARFSSQEVPVEGEFTGSAAEGYLAGDKEDFVFSPKTVVVSGRLDEVNQVARAVVTVTGEGLTETVNGEYAFRLLDRSGNELTGLHVTCDVQKVNVTFPIQATAEIPLGVTFTDGGGVGADEATAELSVESIAVSGTTEAVEAVKAAGAINVATIDLSAVMDGEKLTFPVPLADELTNLTGVEEVEVTVYFNKRLEERTFQVSNISCINVPDGWSADIITQVLSVTVRGRPELLDEITDDSLFAVADLQDVTPAAGGYTAAVHVYLNSAPSAAEVGVLSGEYRIAINLTQGAPAPASIPTDSP